MFQSRQHTGVIWSVEINHKQIVLSTDLAIFMIHAHRSPWKILPHLANNQEQDTVPQHATLPWSSLSGRVHSWLQMSWCDLSASQLYLSERDIIELLSLISPSLPLSPWSLERKGGASQRALGPIFKPPPFPCCAFSFSTRLFRSQGGKVWWANLTR